jgi:hypothetical protein
MNTEKSWNDNIGYERNDYFRFSYVIMVLIKRLAQMENFRFKSIFFHFSLVFLISRGWKDLIFLN